MGICRLLFIVLSVFGSSSLVRLRNLGGEIMFAIQSLSDSCVQSMVCSLISGLALRIRTLASV